jgi:sugar O-acyltransferase (sialic acid O-acetyltransferase NeuD family)
MNSIIIGAGSYGEVYLAYLQETGINIVGFIDDNKKLWGKEVCGVPVLGGMSDLDHLSAKNDFHAVYCPLGNNKLRVRLLKKALSLGLDTPNFIHSTVVISPNVKIGKGVYILMGSMIMPYTEIKDFTMISMNVKVAHHNVLEEGVFLSTGVNVGANMYLKSCAYIGIGAIVMTGVKEIGEDALVGAGSVVIRDVEDGLVVVGNPAKILERK